MSTMPTPTTSKINKKARIHSYDSVISNDNHANIDDDDVIHGNHTSPPQPLNYVREYIIHTVDFWDNYRANNGKPSTNTLIIKLDRSKRYREHVLDYFSEIIKGVLYVTIELDPSTQEAQKIMPGINPKWILRIDFIMGKMQPHVHVLFSDHTNHDTYLEVGPNSNRVWNAYKRSMVIQQSIVIFTSESKRLSILDHLPFYETGGPFMLGDIKCSYLDHHVDEQKKSSLKWYTVCKGHAKYTQNCIETIKNTHDPNLYGDLDIWTLPLDHSLHVNGRTQLTSIEGPSWRKEICLHQQIMDISIALFPVSLQIGPFVLLWIIEYLAESTDMSCIKRLRLIERTWSSLNIYSQKKRRLSIEFVVFIYFNI